MRILVIPTNPQKGGNLELLAEACAGGKCFGVCHKDLYYEMCGQIEMLLDHSNPLYSLSYRFRMVFADG